MPLISNYAGGTFYRPERKWFCSCGEEPKWWTSTTDASNGQRFLRCRKGQGNPDQCSFFLTAEDEPAAREEKGSDFRPPPRTPRTPQGPRNGGGNGGNGGNGNGGGNAQGLPTPDTPVWPLFRRRSSANRRNASPTPRGRFRRAGEDQNNNILVNDDDSDLASTVLTLLRQDGVELKASTEAAIRFCVEERMAVYEAKLEKSAESLARAFKRLDEFEWGARRDANGGNRA